MRIDVIIEPNVSPDQFIALGRQAERYGIGAVWTPNHISVRDPFICFAGLAKESERIRMGPVAVSPFELHPLKMANLLFTVNELSHGRANIVVGGGGGTMNVMGLQSKRMVDTVRECVEILKRTSPDERLVYEGDIFKVYGYQPTWATDAPPLVYVAASMKNMLRMGAEIGDGIMMSDITPELAPAAMRDIDIGLAAGNRSRQGFAINNLFAWHVKPDKQDAIDEARKKIWVRGLLARWYLEPFLSSADCDIVEANMESFIKAYWQKSPVVEGIPDPIMTALVDNLTLTGDYTEVDSLIDRLKRFEAAGFTEFGLRLYEQPAAAIELIGERVVPVFN